MNAGSEGFSYGKRAAVPKAEPEPKEIVPKYYLLLSLPH